MIVPLVYCHKYVSGLSSQSAMQQRLSISHGSTLLRTYCRVFAGIILTSQHTILSSVLSYNTYMDGLRLQDFTLQPSDATHWLYNKKTERFLRLEKRTAEDQLVF